MKLSFSATSYPATAKDWRGVFIRHMAEGLASSPDVDLRIFAPPGPRPANSRELSSAEDSVWLNAISNQGGFAHLLRTRPWSGALSAAQFIRRMRRALSTQGPFDSHHLNWLQTALALPNDQTPAVITALGSDLQLLGIPGMRQLINRKLHGRPVAVCPNADWMIPTLRKKLAPHVQIIPVQFGVEDKWFELKRDPQMRPPVWIAVTRVTRGKIGDLFDWCEPLFANQNRQLHLIGPAQDDTPIPSWVHFHGPTHSDELEGRWFPRAAGLITLSQHAEGRPQVMLEAMAAGLPIIASGIPAHQDFIVEGENGFLVQNRAELASAMSQVEDQAFNSMASERAKRWAQTNVGTWRACADKYLEIHAELQRALK